MGLRIYITTRTVGQSFGTVEDTDRFHPGCPDHGEVLAETNGRVQCGAGETKRLEVNMATDRGWTVVDEDYQP